MGFNFDGKSEDISLKRLTKIANGQTGDVYKYKNSALKIFRKGANPPIDEPTAQHLTTIATQRILLPRKLLFYNKTFVGYTYKLVSKRGAGKRMITLPKDELIGNIAILESDIKTLSDNKVLLNGIDPTNYIFNGDLFISDPSKYSILDIFSTEELERLNKYQLHLLITAILASETKKSNISNAKEAQFKQLLMMKDDEQDSSDFFTNVIPEEDTVKEFILKL